MYFLSLFEILSSQPQLRSNLFSPCWEVKNYTIVLLINDIFIFLYFTSWSYVKKDKCTPSPIIWRTKADLHFFLIICAVSACYRIFLRIFSNDSTVLWRRIITFLILPWTLHSQLPTGDWCNILLSGRRDLGLSLLQSTNLFH